MTNLFNAFFLLLQLVVPSKVYAIAPNQAIRSHFPAPVAIQAAPTSVSTTVARLYSYKKSELESYVRKQAVLYGINPDMASCIVSRESQWNPTNLGPEKHGVSQGLWQIYSLAHPNITRAQTFDPVWATQWALHQIKIGNVGIWSTYNQYCSSTKTFIN